VSETSWKWRRSQSACLACGICERTQRCRPSLHTSPCALHTRVQRDAYIRLGQRFIRSEDVSVGSHGRLEAFYPVFSPRVQFCETVRQRLRSRSVLVTVMSGVCRAPRKFRDDDLLGLAHTGEAHGSTTLQRIAGSPPVSAN
jgi:hypothetical protein